MYMGQTEHIRWKVRPYTFREPENKNKQLVMLPLGRKGNKGHRSRKKES